MQAKELKELDKKHHLHPFTHHPDMHVQGTQIMGGAEGIYVKDENGKSYLDALAGLWCVNVGYGRKEIADAVHRQMMDIAFYPSFFNSTTEPTILLAKRLVELAPEKITHVFFSNSGSEANETALKLIRAYQKLKGTPSKTKILSANYGYHGITLATTSLTRLPSCQTPFDLPLAGFIQTPGPYRYQVKPELSPSEFRDWSLEETEKLIQREGPDTIAALFAEPVQGAGGVVVPPEGYLKSLRELCRKYSILFVADEVITGFGRVGDWFASRMWDLDPDFISTAKGITSGYVPLGATLVRDDVAEVLIKGGYLAHGSTYSGHPVACVAALANIEIIEREDLIRRTREEIGPYFQTKLRELSSHPCVAEVRGIGLIGALELLPKGGRAALSPTNPLGVKAQKLAREEGVIVRGIRDILAMAPPLIIDKSQIDTLFKSIHRVMDRLWD